MAMLIEVMESFTDYTAVSSGAAPWSAHWLLTDPGNFGFITSALEGSRTLEFQSDGIDHSTALYMFAAPVTKVTVGFAFSIQRFGTEEMAPFIELVDATGAAQLYLKINDTGKLVILGEGGAVIATSTMNFVGSTIYRCCFRVEYTGANLANCGLSVHGFDDPNLTKAGVDLQDQSAVSMAGIRLVTGESPLSQDQGVIELHDLMVGTGEVVDWGPIEIVDFGPDADIVSDWTPLSGTDNFAMVDEDQGDGDTTYNSTETLNAKDIFGFPDGEVPETVIAVGLCSWHRKEDSATRRFRHVLRVGGTDYPGPDIFSAETYGRRIDAWTENPDTAVAWDPSELAALEAGYEYLGS